MMRAEFLLPANLVITKMLAPRMRAMMAMPLRVFRTLFFMFSFVLCLAIFADSVDSDVGLVYFEMMFSYKMPREGIELATIYVCEFATGFAF